MRPLILSSLFLLSLSQPSVAQLSVQANEYFDVGNYIEAIDLYTRVLEKDPDNQFFNERLGQSYLKTYIDPLMALDYLAKAESMGKVDKDLYLDLAEASTFHLDYDQALYYLRKFEEEGGVKKKNTDLFYKLINDCLAAQDLLKYPVDVNYYKLNDDINSPYPDYHPFVTKDGSTLYFTSRRKLRPGDKPEFDGYHPSDIFISERLETGWTKAEPLPNPINTPYDEQMVGITNSGDSIFFYIDHVEDFGDIYLSKKEVGRFSKPKPLGKMINTQKVESACSISNDGKTLIFSSEREGGSGKLDLYMVEKLPSAEWGEPKNLGDNINTPLNEDYPTLSGDGKTMYFSSDGHPGMGGYDLFFSTYDDENKVWSKPQNLGYPLNTPFDNKNISYTQSGDVAFMTGIDPGTGTQLDIYEVVFNRTKTDDPAVFLINIPESSNIQGAAPEIVIRNGVDEPVGRYMPNKISGRYAMALYPGKYFLEVDAEGYQPYTEVLIVNNYHTRQDLNVKLIKLQE